MTNFTNAETTLIFELLDMFEIGTFDWFSYVTWPGGITVSVPFSTQIDFSTANTRLNTIISEIETADGNNTDGRRVRISQIISEYSDISLDTATVRSGGGAGMPGARYSPAGQRVHLKKLLQKVLGFSLQKGPLEGLNISGTRRTAVR